MSYPKELSDWQDEIGTWGDAVFPHGTPLSFAEHLLEEAEELRNAIRDGDSFGAHELADVVILAMQVAHRAKLDLATCIWAKMAVNRQRKWGEPDERGVVYHTKEGG